MYSLINFYAFKPLVELDALKVHLEGKAKAANIVGTILLASEGINVMLSGEPSALEEFTQYVIDHLALKASHIKRAQSSIQPFLKLKIRIKPEIVGFKHPNVDPTVCVGEYVSPLYWNELIQTPGVITIDTRNDYEYDIGYFKGAVNPNTWVFSDFVGYVEKNLNPEIHTTVAMYCTGGIRCEKASSFMLQRGFKAVYHLEGGILNYFEMIPPSESLWLGTCFVFDERICVSHPEIYGQHLLQKIAC